MPNLGLGSEFSFDIEAIKSGALATLPLFVLAFVLDFVEESVPALQDVTKATQRSVLVSSLAKWLDLKDLLLCFVFNINLT